MRATELAAAMGDSKGVRWFRAPGRVNLMGDHTDYNEGFVLPMTIDRDCVIAARAANHGRVRIRSLDIRSEEVDVTADGSDDPATTQPEWGRLVAGVVRSLAALGRRPVGMEGAIASTIPIGSGLSSSAAFEVACALALLDVAGESLPPTELALACRDAEEEATGVPCGLMDQLASIAGLAGHALLIDCRTQQIEPIPVPSDLSVLAVHSGLPRMLAGTEYAERRAACERLAATLGVASLRDATLDDVLDDPLARHVVSENLRVIVTARALRNGEKESLAQMFADSHKSLRDDYRVSTPELDLLVNTLVEEGALGARLTGAGFGGCVVAIVETGDAKVVAERAAARYRTQTGLEPAVYLCRAAGGAGPVNAEDLSG